MLELTTLYYNSSNELTQAQDYQSQISRKEFEMRLMEINSQYLQNGSSYLYNNLQKQRMEFDIKNLKHYRDSSLYNSINYALQLAEIELREHITYSMAVVAINSINSFLKTYKPEIVFPPQYILDQLTRIYNTFHLSFVNPLLDTEITNLKQLVFKL